MKPKTLRAYIPHPWWHNWLYTYYRARDRNGNWAKYRCEWCQKDYHVWLKEDLYPEVRIAVGGEKK
jgi:hypothetical protein